MFDQEVSKVLLQTPSFCIMYLCMQCAHYSYLVFDVQQGVIVGYDD